MEGLPAPRCGHRSNPIPGGHHEDAQRLLDGEHGPRRAPLHPAPQRRPELGEDLPHLQDHGHPQWSVRRLRPPVPQQRGDRGLHGLHGGGPEWHLHGEGRSLRRTPDRGRRHDRLLEEPQPDACHQRRGNGGVLGVSRLRRLAGHLDLEQRTAHPQSCRPQFPAVQGPGLVPLPQRVRDGGLRSLWGRRVDRDRHQHERPVHLRCGQLGVLLEPRSLGSRHR